MIYFVGIKLLICLFLIYSSHSSNSIGKFVVCRFYDLDLF